MTEIQPPPPPAPSAAVLPFLNFASDQDQHFADGLSDEIITALSRLPGLQVTARTSSFALRGKERDIREIGRRLNARAVLEGSLRRSGSRIRVTAQLVDTSQGCHLWSERFDRELTDVIAVQDETTRAIVDALRLTSVRRRYAPIESWQRCSGMHGNDPAGMGGNVHRNRP